jgi:UDP-2-acetamido-2,6-beta-L-arabino-hexul-4-ose reductase
LKVLVTGARGFIGKNLCVALRRAAVEVAEVDVESTPDVWAAGVHGAHAVFHAAGMNRPEHESEFSAGNVKSLETLFAVLDDAVTAGPLVARPFIVLASSTQSVQDNPYGRSKLAAEAALESYAARTAAAAVIYRLPGVFGKWCQPDYNSVVATFCHNIARGIPISISDPSRVIELVHVDDVAAEFAGLLEEAPAGIARREVRPVFTASLGDLAARISGFRDSRRTLEVADPSNPFTRRLLGTYTSYVPLEDLAYPLEQRSDSRGTLAELLKSPQFGQMFVSRTRPGVTRGNHYHDLKVEKFCVLEGEAVIRFRPVLGGDVVEHRVSGMDFKMVDIPPGTTHSIENVGAADVIVLFWASETFDRNRPDTHACEVLRD